MIAMAVGSFTAMTFLTKNSFLDEIRKQYVVAARAKGLNESQVLYGHVFRNAMLLIIAGFPAAFIGAFFSGALLIETIFSLDGLGLLVVREHRKARLSGGVCVALYFLARRACSSASSPTSSTPSLIRASTLKRGRFERDGSENRQRRQCHDQSAAPCAACSSGRPATSAGACRRSTAAGLERFKAHKLGYRSFLIFSGPVSDHAVCRIHRQRPAADRELQGRDSVPGAGRLSGRKVRRVPGRHGLQDARHPKRDQRQRLDGMAADPLFLRHHQQGLSRPRRIEQRLPWLSRAAAMVVVDEAVRRAA